MTGSRHDPFPVSKREEFSAESDGIRRSTITEEEIYVAGHTGEGLIVFVARQDRCALSFTLTAEECNALAEVLTNAAGEGQ